jgi:hypothetical protein
VSIALYSDSLALIYLFTSDHIYSRSKVGGDISLELLLEILDISNAYNVMDLFEEVQGEIVERRLLRPDTVDKSEFLSCSFFVSANDLVIKSKLRLKNGKQRVCCMPAGSMNPPI